MYISLLEEVAVTIVKPRSQLALFCITMCCIAGMTYHYVYRDKSITESFGDIIPITPSSIKEWGGNPTIVKTGMHVINFPEFHVLTQQFVCDAILWFDFDPALVSLDTIEKFSFERGNMLKMSSPSSKIIQGRLFVEYTIRLQFTSNLNYVRFPFDDHRINLLLTNIYLSPKDIIFDANRTGFSLAGTMLEWYPIGTLVQSGYTEAYLDKQDQSKVVRHPKVIFSIDFRRIGMRQFLIIFLPLFAIFFTSLLTLCFDPLKMTGTLLSSSSGAIGSMIAYRFVTQSMSPQVGYFLFSDYIFVLFMLLETIQFFLIITMIMHNTTDRYVIFMKGFFVLFVHIFLLYVWYYLIRH